VLKLVVADCCLVSINVATGLSLVNIRLLPSSTADKINFYATISYKLNQCGPTRGPRAVCGPSEAFRKNLQMWHLFKRVWGYIFLTELPALDKVHFVQEQW